jgi:hypothetical protein
MENRRFRKAEPPKKFITCSCGGQAKLIKRRNFPHGRKSKGITSIGYRCNDCKKWKPMGKS